MDNPKISIIVPVYNVDRFLRHCIESILSQTYQNFELLLINDGSYDSSFAIMKEFAEKDSRVKLYTQSNDGVASARNKGLSLATGEFITFVDSDDYVTETYLEDMLRVQLETNADMVISQYYEIDSDYLLSYYFKSDREYNKINKEEIFKDYFKKIFQVLWAKLYKRELFNDLSFYPNRYYEDSFLVTKVYLSAPTIYYINVTNYCYRQQEKSITNSNWNLKKIQDNIETGEEIINDLVISGNDTSLAVNDYHLKLWKFKSLLEEKNLVNNSVYKKIIMKLKILK